MGEERRRRPRPSGRLLARGRAARHGCLEQRDLRVYLEENMSPLRAAAWARSSENTITNRIRAAQELLPHRIEHRSPQLLVALRLIGVTHDA